MDKLIKIVVEISDIFYHYNATRGGSSLGVLSKYRIIMMMVGNDKEQ